MIVMFIFHCNSSFGKCILFTYFKPNWNILFNDENVTYLFGVVYRRKLLLSKFVKSAFLRPNSDLRSYTTDCDSSFFQW